MGPYKQSRVRFEELEFVPSVGMMSCVGIRGTTYPLGHGNYFWFKEEQAGRCVNMWAENLAYLLDNKMIDTIKVVVCSWKETDGRRSWMNRASMVMDDRIPEGFVNKTLCTTGMGTRLPVEAAQMFFEHYGDPHNNLEEYTDPASYWDKRGWIYHPSGSISSKPKEIKC